VPVSGVPTRGTSHWGHPLRVDRRSPIPPSPPGADTTGTFASLFSSRRKFSPQAAGPPLATRSSSSSGRLPRSVPATSTPPTSSTTRLRLKTTAAMNTNNHQQPLLPGTATKRTNNSFLANGPKVRTQEAQHLQTALGPWSEAKGQRIWRLWPRNRGLFFRRLQSLVLDSRTRCI
jgi:hypothetical protein